MAWCQLWSPWLHYIMEEGMVGACVRGKDQEARDQGEASLALLQLIRIGTNWDSMGTT